MAVNLLLQSREDRKIEAYMKAFEIMEKREERKKEALQKICEKKESPDVQTDKVPTDAIRKTRECRAAPQPVQAKVATPKPAARRRRNRSGMTPRRRTASTNTTSQSVSDAEQNDENSDSHISSSTNTSVASTASKGMDTAPTQRVPAPGEVGSTHTGTISATPTPASISFRFPKTKKVNFSTSPILYSIATMGSLTQNKL